MASGDLPLSGLAGREEELLACIHCGFCLPACPTYRVLGDEADSPRGRLHLMRAVGEGRLSASDPSFRTHIDRCLGCRACEPVCPAGVPYGHLLEHAREEIRAVEAPGFLARLLVAVFGRRGPSRLAGWGGRVIRATGLARALARMLPAGGVAGRIRSGMAMLAASAPAPGSLPESRRRTAAPDPAANRPRVGVLAGCVQQGLFGRVAKATRRTLERNGYELVPVVDAGCCGALHAHGGDLDGARRRARAQIRAFLDAGVDRIAVDAAGCGAAMKDYGTLLADDPQWAEPARDFSRRVRDVSELLAEVGPRAGAPLPVRVCYDPPCHLLHAQGVHDPVVRMLEAIPGLELVPLRDAERCCGGAGVYGITHPELGGRIAADKREAILESGADVVVTGNPGCMMQIGAELLLAGAGVRVAHPVELLDESYAREDAGGS